MPTVVRFEQVTMRYGTGAEILHGIDLDLDQGSFHFLTGPSGAGKSTMLRLMYLAERPTGGSITLFGHDVQSLGRTRRAQLRRHIGVVFQEFRLLDHLSAIDNVALPLRVTGIKEQTVMANATELLRWVGLEERHMSAQPST
jgi:cell division transport system ATP-binding protein